MKPQQYDPQSISMTPPALAHVKKQLQNEGASALVLGITESGCNGYMYELSYVHGEVANARSFEFDDDVNVLVEETQWPLVRGTEIDYVTEGLNSMLKFNNPNADSQCGCGESFSLKEDAVPLDEDAVPLDEDAVPLDEDTVED